MHVAVLPYGQKICSTHTWLGTLRTVVKGQVAAGTTYCRKVLRWIEALVVWLRCETLYGCTENFRVPNSLIGVVCGSKAWCVTFFNRPVNVLTGFIAWWQTRYCREGVIQRPKHSVKISSVGITAPLAIYALWCHIKDMKKSTKARWFCADSDDFLPFISLDESVYPCLYKVMNTHSYLRVHPSICNHANTVYRRHIWSGNASHGKRKTWMTQSSEYLPQVEAVRFQCERTEEKNMH